MASKLNPKSLMTVMTMTVMTTLTTLISVNIYGLPSIFAHFIVVFVRWLMH